MKLNLHDPKTRQKVLIGAGLLAGIVTFLIIRKGGTGTSSTSTAPAVTPVTDPGIDPATGVPYALETGAYSGGGLTGGIDPTTGLPYGAIDPSTGLPWGITPAATPAGGVTDAPPGLVTTAAVPPAASTPAVKHKRAKAKPRHPGGTPAPVRRPVKTPHASKPPKRATTTPRVKPRPKVPTPVAVARPPVPRAPVVTPQGNLRGHPAPPPRRRRGR